MPLGQPQTLKEYNRILIERLIFEKGPITKPLLAQMSNLSLPTVNKTVDYLVQRGSVCEVQGLDEGGVGRKAKHYILSKKAGCVLTVNFYEKQWQGQLADLYGRVFGEKQECASGKDLAASMDSLYRVIDGLLACCDSVDCIGVGIPGAVLPDGRATGIPQLPAWENENIRALLEQRYHMPVLLENDVKLMTQGYYSKYIHELDNVAFLYFGSGIGSGLILNGSLYKGNMSFAGELSYMYASDGCSSLETVLQNLAKQLQSGTGGAAALAAYSKEIAAATANVTALLNPDAIVLYSTWLTEKQRELIYEVLKKRLPASVLPRLLLANEERYGQLGLTQLCIQELQQRIWSIDPQ